MTWTALGRAAAPLLALAAASCASADPEARPRTLGFDEHRAVTATVAADEVYASAKLHLESGQYGLALSELQQVLRLEPDSVSALNGLGFAYDMLGRYDVAGTYYRKAIAIQPDAAASLNNYGRSRMAGGDAAGAVRVLERAALVAPADPVIAANLARARAAGGGSQRAAGTQLPAHAAAYEFYPSWPAEPAAEASGAAPSAIARASRLPLPTQLPASAAASWLTGGSHAPVRTTRSRDPAGGIEPGLGLASRGGAPLAPIAFPDPAMAIEVGNGVGRLGMASRIAGHLRPLVHMPVVAFNARPFGRPESVILHHPDHAALAESVAAALPAGVAIERSDDLPTAVRLLLGQDLWSFDDRLVGMDRDPSSTPTGPAGLASSIVTSR